VDRDLWIGIDHGLWIYQLARNQGEWAIRHLSWARWLSKDPTRVTGMIESTKSDEFRVTPTHCLQVDDELITFAALGGYEEVDRELARSKGSVLRRDHSLRCRIERMGGAMEIDSRAADGRLQIHLAGTLYKNSTLYTLDLYGEEHTVRGDDGDETSETSIKGLIHWEDGSPRLSEVDEVHHRTTSLDALARYSSRHRTRCTRGQHVFENLDSFIEWTAQPEDRGRFLRAGGSIARDGEELGSLRYDGKAVVLDSPDGPIEVTRRTPFAW
jgi:hypothetical protein